MNHSSNPFAEIVESSLTQWRAQSWQWDDFPHFGSLVTVSSGTHTIIGLVHETNTGSMDPTRYPFPYKKTEEELRKEQPQIFDFLRTSFSCLTLGYYEKGTYHYTLCPQPPKIHAFVQAATDEQYRVFLAQNEYLHLLFNFTHPTITHDELLIALLKNMAEKSLITDQKITSLVEQFSLLTANDYRRLKVFLQRARGIIQHE